jgi:hypothetical protein
LLDQYHHHHHHRALFGLGWSSRAPIGSGTKCYSARNREWATAICSIAGDGFVVPPFLVVKGRFHLASWYSEHQIPDDWAVKTTPNGWTDNATCLDWLQHFDKHTKDRRMGGYRMLVLVRLSTRQGVWLSPVAVAGAHARGCACAQNRYFQRSRRKLRTLEREKIHRRQSLQPIYRAGATIRQFLMAMRATSAPNSRNIARRTTSSPFACLPIPRI